jgi:WD40 repeat protein
LERLFFFAYFCRMKIKGEIKNHYQAHKDAIYKIIKLDDNHFVSAGGDGCILKWDIHTSQQAILLAQTNKAIYTLAQYGNHLYIGEKGGMLYCIDLENKNVFKSIIHHTKDIFGIYADRDIVVAVSADGFESRWTPQLMSLISNNKIDSKSLRCILYINELQQYIIGSSSHCIYVLDDNIIQNNTTLLGHSNSVFSLCLLSNNILLSGGRDAVLMVWNLDNQQCMQKIQAHLNTINAIELSPNRLIFATASRDKTVKIWNAKDFSLLKVLDSKFEGAHTHSVNSLLWMNDNTLLSAGDDKKIIEWRVECE